MFREQSTIISTGQLKIDGRYNMAKQKKKSVHLHMNLGTLIFLIIVIYLMAYILSYLGKSKLAIYEVSASDIVDSIDGTGVILRKETLVHTEQSGYINYYVQEGSMVRQNGTVYTVDTTDRKSVV